MAGKTTYPAKIIQPVPTEVIFRERLFSRMDQARAKPVILVSGPASCGKTTFVSSYIVSRKLPCLWYQVDGGDDDLATFFFYLGLAAKKAAPRKRTGLPLLTPDYSLGIPTFCRNFFAGLFDRLNTPSVLVFDNYQEVPETSSLHTAILESLNRIPKEINIILISRQDFPAAYARQNLNQSLDAIRWPDLRFTLDEFQEMADIRRDFNILRSRLQVIHDRTDGWIGGLLLLMGNTDAASKETPQFKNELTNDIFNLFAADVIGRLNQEMRDFLLRTAILPDMTPRIAQMLTGNTRAERILHYLHRNNYFTEMRTTPRPVFQYHQMFHDFLKDHAFVSIGADELKKVFSTAIELLVEADDYVAAAELMLQANDTGGLVEIILKHAKTLLKQGRHQVVQGWIESLPEGLTKNTPWLQFWLGECNLTFDPQKAYTHFDKAFELFDKSKDQAGFLLSLAGAIDSILWQWGNLRKIIPWIERLPKMLPENVIGARVASSVYQTFVLILPMHADFEKWEEIALRFASDDNMDESIRANIFGFASLFYIYTSNRSRTEALMNIMAPLVGSKFVIPGVKIEADYAIKSFYYLWKGQKMKCISVVEDGLSLANESGVHRSDLWLAWSAALASITQGDTNSAQKYINILNALNFNKLTYGQAAIDFLKAKTALFSGEIDEALESANAALESFIFVGVFWFVCASRLLKAEIHHIAGDNKKAEFYLCKAKEMCSGIYIPSILQTCQLLTAAISLDKGDQTAGLKSLREGLSLGQEKNLPYSFIQLTRKSMVRLLIMALENGIEEKYTRELISSGNFTSDLIPIHLENWPWPLKFFTLGRFEVVRDDTPIRPAKKSQQKPLALLKALICLGGRKVSDAQIADALWPDAEGDLQMLSLNTTLHRLRKLLGIQEAIRYQEGLLTLDARYCWVDAWALERLIGDIEQLSVDNADRERHLKLSEKAFQMYGGGFLPQHPDADLSMPMREKLKRKMLGILMGAGHGLENNKAWSSAAAWYEKALTIDPLIEECYQRLMICHWHQGQKAEIVTTYKRCCKELDSMLGLEPSDRTKKIFSTNAG